MLTVGIVGATGVVGGVLRSVLVERGFPVKQLRAFASSRSAGRSVPWGDAEVVVEDAATADLAGLDLAIFSAGPGTSLALAPRFVEAGAVVVDNSSAWRMDPDVPLVVPEVNPHAIAGHRGIIANPNCSTIQMVVALKPLHDAARIRRVVVSTYQSVSGAGQKGMHELLAQVEAHVRGGDVPAPAKFAHPIAFNCIPQIDDFLPGG